MNPFEQAEQILKEIEETILNSAEEAEQFRIKYIGSKGLLKSLFQSIKDIPNEKKKEFGQITNKIKQSAEAKVESAKASKSNKKSGDTAVDFTAPGVPFKVGTPLHFPPSRRIIY